LPEQRVFYLCAEAGGGFRTGGQDGQLNLRAHGQKLGVEALRGGRAAGNQPAAQPTQ
jgi:hypothetical protein